jgi:hypothetical protein
MFTQSLFTALLVATFARAVSVTTPNNNTMWSSGTSGQTVSWEAVSSDPTSFVIQLVNQVSRILSPRHLKLINGLHLCSRRYYFT